MRENVEGVNVNGWKDTCAMDGGACAHGRGAGMDGHVGGPH